MSLVHEVLHQQLRLLLKARRRSSSRSDDRRQRHCVAKKSRNRWQSHCNRRSSAGQDAHCGTVTTLQGLRYPSLPVGNRCIGPLLHIWLRLNEDTYSSSHLTRQRYMRRIRLQQRSTLENAWHVCQIHWRNLRQKIWPEATKSIGTQTGYSPYIRIVRESRLQAAAQVSPMRRLTLMFVQISEALESALSTASGSYLNTSAAMELINFGDLCDQLNSVLIDHIIDNVDYTLTPTPSMAQFNTVFPEET
ncbi:hypothetical protein KR093_005253 [Drosophila rubida]|uniref:Uncharacterized protein n=1 Tax=Drosophila rubida TaxID=30044 RepID=A0AAD4PHX6_9MUSC|nr:hypothetical protein KR093_005253 [Drosophila rubida]